MIVALVLAAGASTRFGSHKLLAPLDGEPVVRHAVRRALASVADEVLVVLGRDASTVRAALDGLPVRFVENPNYGAGMSTSLRAGMAALGPRAEAVVIVLGDQPRIEPVVIDQLVAAWREARVAIVAPVYRGVRGHPVLFDAAVFGELSLVDGDRGARAVVGRDPARVAEVVIDAPAPADVDTPEDLAALGG